MEHPEACWYVTINKRGNKMIEKQRSIKKEVKV